MTILQDSFPYDVTPKPLPGIAPLVPVDGWVRQDEVFAQQMALRDQLLAQQRSKVHSDHGASLAAKVEVLENVLAIVRHRPGYTLTQTTVQRPDGVKVALDDDPLVVAARLVQEDLLVHEKPQGGDEHVLTAGVLCFPASWTLGEKAGNALVRIHKPVDDYHPDIARRVQRLFDGIQPGRPLWRHNVLRYRRAELFQPRSEMDPRHGDQDYGGGDFVRSEHQALVRMPKTRAVLFAIHTYVVLDRANDKTI